MNNIFFMNSDMSNADKYNCMVWGYTPKHSQLYIRLYIPPFDPDKHLYLGFHSVKYFSGHMKWVGADFRYETREDVMKFVRSGLIEVSDNEIESFLASYRLFVIERQNFKVSIFAWSDVAIIDKPINSNILIDSTK